ncbi:hypothetical protein D3C80_1480710 [compost metagenome]
MLLGQRAPGQVQAAEQQADLVGAQSGEGLAPQRQPHAGQQRQGIERVDDKHAAQAVGPGGERPQQLRAVHREPVEYGVREQDQRHGQPPAPPLAAFTVQPGNAPTQAHGKYQQVQQRVAVAAVVDHVGQGIAVVDEHVQVRQRARHRPPQGGFRHGCAAPHGGDGHGRAQGDLRNGIHGDPG